MAKHRPKHIVEYFFLRIMFIFFSKTPYRVALSITWVLAWLGFNVIRYRVKSAKTRIKDVFGDQYTKKEIHHIAWESWKNFMFNTIDIFRLENVRMDWIKKHLHEWETPKSDMDAYCKNGVGAVVACPHMGAAETTGVILQRFGVPIFMLTGKQKNPLVDDFINTQRKITKIPAIQRGSSLLKTVIKKLKSGGVLAFQSDVRVAPKGILINFLGSEASVAPGMSMFARLTDVPIIPMIVTRRGWTGHKIEFYDPVYPDKDVPKKEDMKRMTQDVFDIFEKRIRNQPEQWFWYNKRWVLDPP